MKNLKTTLASAITVLLAANAYSLPAPIYTSAQEIALMISDASVISEIAAKTVEPISQISASKFGYEILAGDCTASVKLTYPAFDVEGPIGGTSTPAIEVEYVTCDASSTLNELRSQINALAADLSCDSDSQCQTAGFDLRACGGFDNFLIYSSANTDETELNSKLAEFHTLQNKYMEDNGVVSICSMEMPPQLVCNAQKICSKK